MAQTFDRPLVAASTALSGARAPDSGALGFAAITGTTAGTANTVLTTTSERLLLEAMNTTDADLKLVVGGVDTNLILRAGQSKIYDLHGALSLINGATVVAVYRRSGAPTSGECIVQLI